MAQDCDCTAHKLVGEVGLDKEMASQPLETGNSLVTLDDDWTFAINHSELDPVHYNFDALDGGWDDSSLAECDQLPSFLPTSCAEVNHSFARDLFGPVEGKDDGLSTFSNDSPESFHVLSLSLPLDQAPSHTWQGILGDNLGKSTPAHEPLSYGAIPDLPSSNSLDSTWDFQVNGQDLSSSFLCPLNDEEQTPFLTESSTPKSVQSADVSGLSDKSNEHCDNDSQRWHATLSRSRRADRSFLYGVLTTKIYCRPSCPSRRPSRRHVRFFSFPGAIEEAGHAGFRPCRRCRPDTLGTANSGILGIHEVLRTIIRHSSEQGFEEILKLDNLSKVAGLSTFHFHRLFKATTQMTPGNLITACRSLTLQDWLSKNQGRIPDAEIEAAWSTRAARKALGGISPRDYAGRSTSKHIEYCLVDTLYGEMCIAFSTNKARSNIMVHAVLLGQDSETLIRDLFLQAKLSVSHAPRLEQCVRTLERVWQDCDASSYPDLLAMLWRARVWLKFTHDFVLE